MVQPELFDSLPEWADDPIGRKWFLFHTAHPEVGREFVRLAREWRTANPSKPVGSKAIFEVLRWQAQVGAVATEAEPYRLNNVMTPLYSRWAMTVHPDLRGAFNLRERIAA